MVWCRYLVFGSLVHSCPGAHGSNVAGLKASAGAAEGVGTGSRYHCTAHTEPQKSWHDNLLEVQLATASVGTWTLWREWETSTYGRGAGTLLELGTPSKGSGALRKSADSGVAGPNFRSDL